MWHYSEIEYPNRHEMWVGDRLLLHVRERPNGHAPLRDFIIVIESTETGWTCGDETFDSYGPGDGLRWAYEKDALALTPATEKL